MQIPQSYLHAVVAEHSSHLESLDPSGTCWVPFFSSAIKSSRYIHCHPHFIELLQSRASETAQWLESLAAKPDGPSLRKKTHS